MFWFILALRATITQMVEPCVIRGDVVSTSLGLDRGIPLVFPVILGPVSASVVQMLSCSTLQALVRNQLRPVYVEYISFNLYFKFNG